MRPVQASVDVPQSRQDVYDYLDLLANHERFTDHMMRDWHFEGPPRGIGARAKLNAVLGGRTDPLEVEVIEAEPPVRNVERNIGAGGRRVGTGTYTLDQLPDGGTRVSFEYAWQKVPLSERLAAPFVRRIMRKAVEQAMERLAAELKESPIAQALKG